jgi:hypothetical protein
MRKVRERESKMRKGRGLERSGLPSSACYRIQSLTRSFCVAICDFVRNGDAVTFLRCVSFLWKKL